MEHATIQYMTGLSHCCLAPMDTNSFPHTCQACEGACEPAEPGTPTHTEDVVSATEMILNDVKSGAIRIDKAQELLMQYFDEECQVARLEACQEMRKLMEGAQLIPIVPTDRESQCIIRGYDIAMQVYGACLQEVYLDKDEQD